jgi:hypothetical protein
LFVIHAYYLCFIFLHFSFVFALVLHILSVYNYFFLNEYVLRHVIKKMVITAA